MRERYTSKFNGDAGAACPNGCGVWVATKMSTTHSASASLGNEFFSAPQLPDNFHSKLNFPGRGAGPRKSSGDPRWSSSSVKYIRVVRSGRRGKVRMVQQIEQFRPELHVEGLRYSSNVVVFEY